MRILTNYLLTTVEVIGDSLCFTVETYVVLAEAPKGGGACGLTLPGVDPGESDDILSSLRSLAAVMEWFCRSALP
jgi:hypothetical protein